ncbi:MAG: ACP S-malonyltransferase, partial [Ignavibacteriaceae bacterium]
IKVVRIRGQAMQQAGVDKPGTMAAIIGMDADEVDELCKEAESEGIVNCANFNSPSQVVISGSVDGVRKTMELCKAGGAKLVKELVVSGAFHSSLMSSAKDKLKTVLDETHFYDSKFPVYANVTANSVTSKDETKNLLYQQVTSPVRWEEIINNMIADGYDEFYEIGPGKVLTGLLKRINPDVSCISIDKYADVEKYI